MKQLIKNLLNEALLLEALIKFDNWKIPSLNQLKLEFRVEHELKGNDFFNSEEEFLSAVTNGEIISVDNKMDNSINYRSNTKTKEELLSLIKSYRSYPEFRNEKTLNLIFAGFINNTPMDLPIIVEFKSGKRRIFSGNTRMDIAFQLGITPKAILIKSTTQ